MFNSAHESFCREGNLVESNRALFEISRASAAQYDAMSAEFKANTKLMKDMKYDLDFIFEKIRRMKATLKSKYPESVPQRTYTVEDD